MPDPAVWPWFAIPAFFVALWLAIFAVIAWWGGWGKLAEAYPSLGDVSGERFRMRSAQFRAGCNYNNCITLVASPAGLRLSMPAPFRFRHPPIFLPWSELQAREERVLWTAVVELTARRCPEIPIKVRRRLATQLLAHAAFQLEISPSS